MLMVLGAATTVYGVERLPNYQLQYLGPGLPSAINNNGVVVGAKINGNNYEPLVSVAIRSTSKVVSPASYSLSMFQTVAKRFRFAACQT